MMTTTQRKRESFATANLECAKIIAQDPAKYPPDSLPGIWARLVLSQVERTAPVIDNVRLTVQDREAA